MNTDVGLQAVGEALQDHVHVDAVRVRPRVLERELGDGRQSGRDKGGEESIRSPKQGGQVGRLFGGQTSSQLYVAFFKGG